MKHSDDTSPWVIMAYDDLRQKKEQLNCAGYYKRRALEKEIAALEKELRKYRRYSEQQKLLAEGSRPKSPHRQKRPVWLDKPS